MNHPDSMTPLPKRRRISFAIRLLAGFGGLVALAAVIIYPVENWRGKRAWEKCKRELEARGEVFDWNAYIPPPVPDEQNIFKAPHMTEWFVGRGTNEFGKRLDFGTLASVIGQSNNSNVVAEVTLVPLDGRISPDRD